jgi:hypothetical protein
MTIEEVSAMVIIADESFQHIVIYTIPWWFFGGSL